MRDFLTDLHPLKDVRGLNIGKKYNFSRVSTATIDPDVPPLDDFVRPNDVISPRSTGYTQGHMRSLLHFDTFGPQSSRIATLGREIGLLPESPNVDRYSKKNEDRRSASASAASSRCSTSSSNNLPSFRASQSRARLAKFSREGLDMPHSLQFDEIQQLFHPSMSTSNLHHNSSAYSTSKTIGEQSKVSVGTLGYHGRAISVEDRLIAGDPFVTRTLWFKSYQQRIKVAVDPYFIKVHS